MLNDDEIDALVGAIPLEKCAGPYPRAAFRAIFRAGRQYGMGEAAEIADDSREEMADRDFNYGVDAAARAIRAAAGGES